MPATVALVSDSLISGPSFITTILTDVNGGNFPGTAYNGTLSLPANNQGLYSVELSERFVGQTRSSDGAADVISGSPTAPLTLLSGGTNQNLAVVNFAPGVPVVSGQGAELFPSPGASGPGAVAARFRLPQRRIAFNVVGSNSGSLRARFYNVNGELLSDLTISPLQDRQYSFATSNDLDEISGVLLTNSDVGGIGYHSFRLELYPAPFLRIIGPSPASGLVGAASSPGAVRLFNGNRPSQAGPHQFFLNGVPNAGGPAAAMAPASGTISGVIDGPSSTDLPYTITPQVEGLHTITLSTPVGGLAVSPATAEYTALASFPPNPPPSPPPTYVCEPGPLWADVSEQWRGPGDPISAPSRFGALYVAGRLVATGVKTAGGTRNHILVSADHGASWGQTPIGLPGSPSGAYLAAGAGVIYCARIVSTTSAVATVGISRSLDGGLSFAETVLQIPANVGALPASDPYFPAASFSEGRFVLPLGANAFATVSGQGIANNLVLLSGVMGRQMLFAFGRWVGVGKTGACYGPSLASGAGWALGTTPAGFGGHRLALGAGLLLAINGRPVGESPATAQAGVVGAYYTTANGISWTQRAFPDASFVGHAVVFGQGVFVATGTAASGPQIWVSQDGLTWIGGRALFAGATAPESLATDEQGNWFAISNTFAQRGLCVIAAPPPPSPPPELPSRLPVQYVVPTTSELSNLAEVENAAPLVAPRSVVLSVKFT